MDESLQTATNSSLIQVALEDERTSRRDAAEVAMAPRPTVLDLFCGAGGLALGFHQAGYNVVGGVDNFAEACASFHLNITGSRAETLDLTKTSAREVRGIFGSRVDVLVGGPSCQGFSTSGGFSKPDGRDKDDPRNSLFRHYLDVVTELQPLWIVMENVPGLLLYHRGIVARRIVGAFKEVGYDVVPMILLAADFGVPQLRRRLVFVGNRTGAAVRFPIATHGDALLWQNYALPFAHLSRIGQKNVSSVPPHATFDDACSDLPELHEGDCIEEREYELGPRSKYQDMMREGSNSVTQHHAFDLSELDRLAAEVLEPGQNWRNLPKERLPERFSRIRPYDATTMYRRLEGSRPAFTITTKFNEASTGAFIHPTQNRTLSIREAARLQSFPDKYRFVGSPAQIRTQIGNAVPPLLAQAIAEAILPSVVHDGYGVDVPEKRGVVEVFAGDDDFLKLRAPRRLEQRSELQPRLL